MDSLKFFWLLSAHSRTKDMEISAIPIMLNWSVSSQGNVVQNKYQSIMGKNKEKKMVIIVVHIFVG